MNSSGPVEAAGGCERVRRLQDVVQNRTGCSGEGPRRYRVDPRRWTWRWWERGACLQARRNRRQIHTSFAPRPTDLGESTGELRRKILGGLPEEVVDAVFARRLVGEPDRVVDGEVDASVEGDRVHFGRILFLAVKDHDEGLAPRIDVADGDKSGGQFADPLPRGIGRCGRRPGGARPAVGLGVRTKHVGVVSGYVTPLRLASGIAVA